MKKNDHIPCQLENCPHCGNFTIPTHLLSNRYLNKACPCGSGKKFKKCCRLKNILKRTPPDDFHPIPTKVFPRGGDVHIKFCGDGPLVLKRINNYRVYVPRPDLAEAFRLEMQDYISENMKNGEIRDPKEIRDTILKLLGFCQESFERSLKEITSLNMCEFLIKNFEQWHLVLEDRELLNAKENADIRTHGAIMKKAIAHCLEHYASYHPGSSNAVPQKHLSYWLERMLISAYELVALSEKTTQSAMLLSNECWLVVDHKNSLDPINIRVPIPLAEKIEQFHLNNSSFEFNEATFSYRKFDQHLDKGINDVFLECLGMSWDQIISLNKIFNECAQEKSELDISMAYEEEVYEKISQELPVTKEQAKTAISAFVLSGDSQNSIELHRTKRPNRFLRRPYVRTLHKERPLLCWSEKISQRFTWMRSKDMIYGLIPQEWMHEKITKHLQLVSRKIDKEWEEHVYMELGKLGISGKMRIKRLMGNERERLEVDPLVGEIDLLLYDKKFKTLIVGDCKRLKQGWSSHEFIKDKSAFFEGNSYIKKITKKQEWCINNLQFIANSLRIEGDEIACVFPIIITEFESAAQIFTDLSIYSLTRLKASIQSERPPWLQKVMNS